MYQEKPAFNVAPNRTLAAKIASMVAPISCRRDRRASLLIGSRLALAECGQSTVRWRGAVPSNRLADERGVLLMGKRDDMVLQHLLTDDRRFDTRWRFTSSAPRGRHDLTKRLL